MQTQTYDGYFENGRFYTQGKPIAIPEGRRLRVTLYNEPAQTQPPKPDLVWLAELERLVQESADEELNIEDFPRFDLGREPIIFDEDED
ncbi:MAG: hypothetical protein FWB71_04280 [Defluviitaleaceae bacterium]|nr:hypothetical protein [Defluviitaleaceae bacterium]